MLRFPPGSYQGLDALYDPALERLRAAGAIPVEVMLRRKTRISADETLALKTEIKADLAHYLAGAATSVQAAT